MFSNFLIGLREGLEASLVVCILIAYLVKTGNKNKLVPIWIGVGIAIVVSLAFGAGLEFGSQEMTFKAQEALGGSLSIVSVGLVTWMVFWMRRTARHLKTELHGKLDAALAMGTGALVATALLAVGREGLETSLFVWRAVHAADDGWHPMIGAFLGIGAAVVLGWLFYRGALKINLSKFFTWTGGMLVIVAAGVLAYGVHDLQEAEFLGGIHNQAFDISATIPPDSWYGTLLKGTFNFQPDPTVLQITVWALYLIPTLALFLAPVGFGRSGGRRRIRRRGKQRMRSLRPIRLATGLATATVLAVTASGCVTVHGELEVVPAATRSEAAQALKDFTAAYNAADKAYDPALDADRVTGSLGAINQAGLKARQKNNPDGNANHQPLELTDARYVIPKKAGWPRWFLADTDSNRDEDGGKLDTRWLLVFVKSGPGAGWKTAYLSVVAPSRLPALAKDGDGSADPVVADSAELAVAPEDLSTQYTDYLQKGAPDVFAPSSATSGWREARRTTRRAGFSYQYIDQPLDSGTFAPLGLATKDGGALVFFSSKHFERQTAAEGLRPPLNPDVEALMTGEMKSTLTKERVSSQLVYVPKKGAKDGKVVMLNRLPGLTAAKGS